MVQINFLKIKQWLKTNLGYLLAFFLFIALTRSCNSEELALVKVSQREAQNRSLTARLGQLGNSLAEKDALISQSDKKIAKMKAKEISLTAQLEKEKKKGEVALAKTKNFDLKEWRAYYVDRTSMPKDILLGPTTVNFTKEPLRAIGQDLIYGDVAKAQLKIKTESLTNARNIISEKDSIIKNQNRKMVNMAEMLATKDTITENLNKDKIDLLKALKKANRPKIGTILISAAVGAAAGATLSR